jgi:hypothetical protein
MEVIDMENLNMTVCEEYGFKGLCGEDCPAYGSKEECKEECNETEKLYGVYGEDNEGVPCYNPNKIFSDIKMAKEYAILQKGKIAWGIAPVYEIFPKTVYEKVKKIDVRE